MVRPMTPEPRGPDAVTWSAMVEAVPPLAALRERVRGGRRRRRRSWRQYERTKGELSALVGWWAPSSTPEWARTARAFAVALGELIREGRW